MVLEEQIDILDHLYYQLIKMKSFLIGIVFMINTLKKTPIVILKMKLEKVILILG